MTDHPKTFDKDGLDPAISAHIDAQDARIAELEAALQKIDRITADCERINLIGKTPDAKLAGTIRNIRAALNKDTEQ